MYTAQEKHSSCYTIYNPFTDPSSLEFQLQGYGGFGYDTTHLKKDDKVPKIVKAAGDGDIGAIKNLVKEASKNGDKEVRLLVNMTQRWTEVDYKMSGFTKEYEWHGLTALAEAVCIGHFDIAHYLLTLEADPTLEGCLNDGEYANAFKAVNLCKTVDSERIKKLLEAVKPLWKDAEYKSSRYSKDRVAKAFPNQPTDKEGLQKVLLSFV